jgi:hypothetical protein
LWSLKSPLCPSVVPNFFCGFLSVSPTNFIYWPISITFGR